MEKLLRSAFILFGTLGWWGFVYPELCLTRETCGELSRIEEGALFWGEELPQGEASFWDEASESGKRIRIKSKLLEYILEAEPEKESR